MKRILLLLIIITTSFSLSSSAHAVDDWSRRYQLKRVTLLGYARDAPDSVLLRSNDTGVYQLYALDAKTGKRTQLTNEPSGRSSGDISPDGRWVYYLKDDHGSETGSLARMPFAGGPEELLDGDLPAHGLDGVTFDRSAKSVAFATSDANGYHCYRLESGKRKPLFESKNEAYGPTLSADGKYVAIAETERKNNRHFAALFINAATGERLNELFDGDPNSVDPEVWSPVRGDERVLLLVNRSGYFRPEIFDLKTRKRIGFDITLPGSWRPAGWSPDARSVLLSQELDGRKKLFLYKVASKRLTAIATPEGMVYGASIRPDGKIWTMHESAATTPRLFEIDDAGHATVKLASEEAPPGTPLTSIHFPGARGESIHAFLGVPKTRNGAAIVYVHGGPRSSTADYFLPALQGFLDSGYVVIAPNYHGSEGFGRDFGESIVGDPMRLELEDFAAARRHLVEAGLAKADLIFVTGWSYGGYSTLACLVQQPNEWAGGVAGVAIADVVMQYEEARESLRGWIITNFGGTPREKGTLMHERSPLTYAEQLKAPLLIIQGKHDSRTPPRQIQELEKRLAELKKDFAIHWFDAGHGSLAIAEQILDEKLALDFFATVVSRVRLSLN